MFLNNLNDLNIMLEVVINYYQLEQPNLALNINSKSNHVEFK
jgi:hypothetical protein